MKNAMLISKYKLMSSDSLFYLISKRKMSKRSSLIIAAILEIRFPTPWKVR